jgi:OOP family OmpA-OmpF porin
MAAVLRERVATDDDAEWAVSAWRRAITAHAASPTVDAVDATDDEGPTALEDDLPEGPPPSHGVAWPPPAIDLPEAVNVRRRRLALGLVAAVVVLAVVALVATALARRGASGGAADGGTGPDGPTTSVATTLAPGATTLAPGPMAPTTVTTVAVPPTMAMPTTVPPTTAMTDTMPGMPTTMPPSAGGDDGPMGTSTCPDPGAGGIKVTVAESVILLEGSVPDAGQKAALRAAVPLREPIDDAVHANGQGPSAMGLMSLTQLLPGLDENLVDGTATAAGDNVCVSGDYIDEVARQDLAKLTDAIKAQGGPVDVHVNQHDMSGALHVHDLQLILNRLAAKNQVAFAEGRAELQPGADTTLDYISQQVIARFHDYPDLVLEIKGYTDSAGSDAANLALSQARAERVMNELIARGLSAQQVRAQGFGEADPVATNDTPEGRAQNRRVVFGVAHVGDAMPMG